MDFSHYQTRLRQWRQQYSLDRLILLTLLLSNGYFAYQCRQPTPVIEVSLPFLDQHGQLQAGEASAVYHEWWGLSLAELLGNLNEGNLAFVESRLATLFSPGMHSPVRTTLAQQFRQLKEDRVNLSFAPRRVLYDPDSGRVTVTGDSVVRSPGQRLDKQKVFTFKFDLIRFRPVLTELGIESL